MVPARHALPARRRRHALRAAVERPVVPGAPETPAAPPARPAHPSHPALARRRRARPRAMTSPALPLPHTPRRPLLRLTLTAGGDRPTGLSYPSVQRQIKLISGNIVDDGRAGRLCRITIVVNRMVLYIIFMYEYVNATGVIDGREATALRIIVKVTSLIDTVQLESVFLRIVCNLYFTML